MERPILFSAPMVRAILEGRKTQTRRAVKFPGTPPSDAEAKHLHPCGFMHETGFDRVKCPYGKPGDHLWVKETWGLRRHFDFTDWCRDSIAGVSELPEEWELDYRADWGPNQESCFWRPSIHMPRWASRITLELTSVRVERLQAISEEDARAEGVERAYRDVPAAMGPCESWVDYSGVLPWCTSARESYATLWKSINGPGSWEENPWVWVLGFTKAKGGG